MEDNLIIVNNKNIQMGWGRKEEIEYLNMSFRCVHVLVFIDDKLILPKFSMNKRKFPNMVTSSAVGHVKKYEDNESAAKRCLWECLGIKKEILKDIGEFNLNYGKSIVFHKVYSTTVKSEKEIEINPIEFQGYTLKSIKEIEGVIKNSSEFMESFKKSFSCLKREKNSISLFNNF